MMPGLKETRANYKKGEKFSSEFVERKSFFLAHPINLWLVGSDRRQAGVVAMAHVMALCLLMRQQRWPVGYSTAVSIQGR